MSKKRPTSRKGTAAERIMERIGTWPIQRDSTVGIMAEALIQAIGAEIDAAREDAGLPMDASGLVEEWSGKRKGDEA